MTEEKKKEPNYKALFVLGIVFIGTGVSISASAGNGMGAGIMGLGVVFMFIGARNRDKWKK